MSSATTAAPAVHCKGLVHVFATGTARITALHRVDLRVEHGETVALLGPSGAGKTTLLWHLAGLLQPTAGSVEVYGNAVQSMNAAELRQFRLGNVGVLLQNPGRNLLSYESALSNLEFAQRSTGRPRVQRREAARSSLASVGLERIAHQQAGRLSGGEQQRLGLAVALVNSPRLLLADEPTSQLDTDAAQLVLEMLATANRAHGTTVLTVTHDPEVAGRVGRTITIRDGRVGTEGRDGEDLLVVGQDGSVQLPPHVLTKLPPGSLLRASSQDDVVELRRVDGPGSDEATETDDDT